MTVSHREHIPFRQKLGLAAFGFFLTFLLLETALRLGGFIILSLQAHQNALVMRQKNVYWIMCIGESTTAGQYPRILAHILNQSDTGIRFGVIDRGILGTNTSFLLNRLESDLDSYHPDMVVAMMGINDHGPHMPYEPQTDSRTVRFIRTLRTYKLARIACMHLASLGRRAGIVPHETAVRYVTRESAYCEQTRSVEAAFREALGINPRDGRAYEDIGRFYRDHGKFPEAEAAFNKTLGINPRDEGSYVGLGWMRLSECRWGEAVAVFKKALEINPMNDQAYEGMGRGYFNQRKFEEAEATFGKALATNPRNDRIYVQRGLFYQNQGQPAEAEAEFKKALGINPRNSAACVALGHVCRMQGKFAEAAQYREAAEELGLAEYDSLGADNYRRLKEILDRRGVQLVCVQYPMRSLASLRKMLQGHDDGIIYVDNERIFRDAVKRDGPSEYFRDMFAGDFGHCTRKGNELLAGNIAGVILREFVGKLWVSSEWLRRAGAAGRRSEPYE